MIDHPEEAEEAAEENMDEWFEFNKQKEKNK